MSKAKGTPGVVGVGENADSWFRAAFEMAPAAMAILGADRRLIAANLAFAVLCGRSLPGLEDLPLAELLALEQPPIEPGLAVVRRCRRGDGGEITLRFSAVPLGDPTLAGPLLLTAAQLPEPNQAAADFHGLVETAEEAVAITSLDGRLLYVNPAHRRLFGYGSGAPGHLRDHLPTRSRLRIEREIGPALTRGESWEGVLDARQASGRAFPLWYRAGVVRDGGGAAIGYFAFMHDHSAAQAMLDELAEAKAAAEQANHAKTRFLAAASHDLRQPLQALNMFIAVLANRPHGPNDQVLIGRIQESVAALEGLLNSLLDVSKLDAGLVVPAPQSFALAEVLERIALEFHPQAEAAGLSLTICPVAAVVHSDPALLERILRHLVGNALRYTQSGKVLVGCRRHGDVLRLEVWDTGPGIPDTQLPLIFREFHQIGNPARDRRQGLGLGLAIVDRMVRLLRHRIEVRSALGKGSVFALDLPLVAAGTARLRPRQLQLGLGHAGAVILVIDDEPDVLDSTRLLLESWNHTVLVAADCDAALRRLAELRRAPDLILADFRLANGSTGGQAIARIRSRVKKAVPAIILTGDTAPERLRQAKAGGHGLLHKPVQAQALRAAIEAALEPAGRPAGMVEH